MGGQSGLLVQSALGIPGVPLGRGVPHTAQGWPLQAQAELSLPAV